MGAPLNPKPLNPKPPYTTPPTLPKLTDTVMDGADAMKDFGWELWTVYLTNPSEHFWYHPASGQTADFAMFEDAFKKEKRNREVRRGC